MLVNSISGHGEFKDKFYRQLQLKVNEHPVLQVSGHSENAAIVESRTPLPTLSQEARVLLKEASQDRSGGLPAQRLREAWEANEAYFRAGSTSAVPPLACLPIYLITIGAGPEERIVYVGQTSSKSSRFVAGHKAMTLLHAPKYEGMRKRLYRCCVVLLSDRNNEIPIEWVTPYEEGRALLSTVEGMLIHWFQPELNVKLKRNPPSIKIGSIHIQNVTGDGSYLNDNFVWP